MCDTLNSVKVSIIFVFLVIESASVNHEGNHNFKVWMLIKPSIIRCHMKQAKIRALGLGSKV